MEDSKNVLSGFRKKKALTTVRVQEQADKENGWMVIARISVVV